MTPEESRDHAAAIAALDGMRAACVARDGGCAVLAAVAHCLQHSLVAPAWLADAFRSRRLRVVGAHVGSWDHEQAFGRPWKKGTRLPVEREKIEVRAKVHGLVWQIVRDDPLRAIDTDLFEEVGESPDASLGAVVQALPALVVPPNGLRDEPETWMLYACMLLLGHERMRRKTVVLKESPQRRH